MARSQLQSGLAALVVQSHLWLLSATLVGAQGQVLPSGGAAFLHAHAASIVSSVDRGESANGNTTVGIGGNLIDDIPVLPAGEASSYTEHKHGRSPRKPHPEFNDYYRWLWWLIVLYFFWAQAEVCDEYFVPTIEVISDIFHIPEDVAGATIMALGCNGPELFINTVSMFQSSDLGIGAVVGGEVFNLLVLCGCAVLVTPNEYMPLQLSKFSFTRDILFYAASVGLLYWAMQDNLVSIYDSLVLLASGGVYSTVVANSDALRQLFGRGTGEGRRVASGAARTEPAASAAAETEVVGPALRGRSFSSFAEDGQLNASPQDGCVLRVRVQFDNRFVDRSRHWDRRFIRLAHEGLLVSTDVRPIRGGRTARGIVYEHGRAGQEGAWHHGGLVNAPASLRGEQGTQWASQSVLGCGADGPDFFARGISGPTEEIPRDNACIDTLDSSAGSLDRVVRAASDPDAPVDEKPWEFIPLRDVIACRAAVSAQSSRFEMQVLQRGSDVLAKVVRLQFDASSPQMRRRWVAAIASGMQASTQVPVSSPNGSIAAASPQRRSSALREWMDWLRFPVQFLLRITIPDVKKASRRRWYPLAFIMSMCWLAVFSFCVVEICDIIHDEFGISVTILGFTLAAIGTSFPNVISCIAVSRQGRTSMAIANALGANIQNVFLALALPWTIHVLIKGGPFRVAKTDLNTSVVAMLVTLVLLIIVVLAAKCRMPRWAGAAFLLMYAVYLVITIGQDVVCSSWPLPC